ncbi:MAG: Quercetin 2,3-dioxygenase [Chroococcidiopsis cubana SAG 39.79]|nr:hypothetical protein [Chroococcidiopsis cubana]MDZ4872047.1 Quercetin 2,3-dioxygenase [Chroococcidiopsis cubana SAG 39.79]
MRLIAAKDGRDGAVTIHQDVNLYSAILQPQDRVTYQLQPNRYAWLQVARGAVALNGHSLNAGDGVAIGAAELLEISSDRDAEILLFDLA